MIEKLWSVKRPGSAKAFVVYRPVLALMSFWLVHLR